MASFRQNIKIFNEIAKKQGMVQTNSSSLQRVGQACAGSRAFSTAMARRSLSSSRADPTLVTTNFKQYSPCFHTFQNLPSNTNGTTQAMNSRNFSSKSKDESCDSPCPKVDAVKKNISRCRETKSCTEMPKDHCLCAPRHVPRPPPERSAILCPPRESQKEKRCTTIKIPLPGCTLPVSTSCIKYATPTKCVKLEAPIPSYSECIKDPTPKAKPTECRLSERMRYLQPSNKILAPLSYEKMLPEVDTYLDPCMGQCCKRVDLTGRPPCPDKASSARLQCYPIGVPVSLPGCLKPDNFDCVRMKKREPCEKPYAPWPSFSECEKGPLKQLKYKECDQATKKTRAFAEMRSLGIPITRKTIEEGRCVREGLEWNCGADGSKGFYCKPTGNVLECSILSLKERQMIAEAKCKKDQGPCP